MKTCEKKTFGKKLVQTVYHGFFYCLGWIVVLSFIFGVYWFGTYDKRFMKNCMAENPKWTQEQCQDLLDSMD